MTTKAMHIYLLMFTNKTTVLFRCITLKSITINFIIIIIIITGLPLTEA